MIDAHIRQIGKHSVLTFAGRNRTNREGCWRRGRRIKTWVWEEPGSGRNLGLGGFLQMFFTVGPQPCNPPLSCARASCMANALYQALVLELRRTSKE